MIMVELVGKSLHLITAEVIRWKDLLWEDYLYFQNSKDGPKNVDMHLWLLLDVNRILVCV